MMQLHANLSRRHFATLTGVAAAGLLAVPAVLAGKPAAAQPSPAASGGDAFQMLIDDHKKVAALMQQMPAPTIQASGCRYSASLPTR